ncbi:hypothetical protein DY218_27305 [Streptomyces triticagri]|uniref:Uncharacterized protein n=1 Tax=Streptomyces triticagri TaxID=2293568 RepID=A0A372M006_9ACTN|nr:hypothetical protein [Streptomyces triticagri]RFU83617.1 hypothetical protein DY218_27305 [Streptomyces triticagri]
MPRCGCGQGCSCRVLGIDPIFVEGNGSASTPYIISLEHNGQTGACALVSAIGDHAGPGLRYNRPCELATYASADAGNQVGYGSDGGLYVPDPDNELPPSLRCVRTVEWLAAQEFWHGGYNGAGSNIAPYGSMSAIEHAAALNLPAIRIRPKITADGRMVIINEPDLTRPADYSPPALVEGTEPKDVPSQTIRAMTNRVANWYGLGYDDEPMHFVSDAWADYGDRFVWFLYLDNADVDAGQHLAVRDEILAWCMQDQVVVCTGQSRRSALQPLTDAGIAIGAFVNAAALESGLTPQEVLDAGCTWALLERDIAPDALTPWAESALNAVQVNVSVRVQADAARDAGMAGVLSLDPPYTSRTGYVGRDQWFTQSMMSGQLSAATVLRNLYRREAPRGVKRPSGGWIFPTQSTIRGGTVLFGFAENTPSTAYGWDVEIVFHQDGGQMTAGSAGLAFATTDDTPVSAWAPNATDDMWFHGTDVLPAPNGYVFTFTAAGNMTLYRLDNGATTQLATAAPVGGGIVRSEVYPFRCEIEGDTVRAVRLDPESGNPVQTVEATDATHRGVYVHGYKYIGDTALEWDVAFRNLTPSAPAQRLDDDTAGILAGPRIDEPAATADPLPPDQDDGWEDSVPPIPPEAGPSDEPYPPPLTGPDPEHPIKPTGGV